MKVSMEKQRVAEEVASILKLSVDIDTSSVERSAFLETSFSLVCIGGNICYLLVIIYLNEFFEMLYFTVNLT